MKIPNRLKGKHNIIFKKKRDGKTVVMKMDSAPDPDQQSFDCARTWPLKHGDEEKNKIPDGFVVMRNKPPDEIPLGTGTGLQSRYRIQDEGGHFKDGFNIFDKQTNQKHQIDFAFCGKDTNQSATWDFAPLGEMREVDGGGFNNFRTKLHQDDRFVEQQLMMNRREHIFHQAGTNKGVTDNGLHMFGGRFNDPITNSQFRMTSDVRFGKDLPPLLQRLEYNINPIFKPLIRKTISTKLWINKYLKLNRSPDDILKEFAENKSRKLLKSWLTEKEYDSLMNLGEMEIYNDDEIYIVKKNPHDVVKVKKNNGRGDCQLQEEFCIIPQEYGYASGDVLLTKVMMIKTNPENFKQVAIRR